MCSTLKWSQGLSIFAVLSLINILAVFHSRVEGAIPGALAQATPLVLYGVQRQRPEDNPYASQWLKELQRRAKDTIVYSSIDELVAKTLERLGKAQCIGELTLIGYGGPGLFTVGKGQSPNDEWPVGTYIHSSNKDVWTSALAPLKGRFCAYGTLNLLGCSVGAGTDGATLVFELANFLGVKVRAPVEVVYGGQGYLGPWQMSIPTARRAPEPMEGLYKKQLIGSVASIRREIRARELRLTKITVSSIIGTAPVSSGAARGLVGVAAIAAFDADEVAQQVEDGRSRLIKSLDWKLSSGLREDFSPLRDYIQEYYPRATSIPKFRSREYPRALISSSTKDAVFADVYKFFSRIESVSNRRYYCIDLRVISIPSEASVRLWATGGRLAETTTENVISNVYFGRYRYRIEKSGFKPIEGSINTVEEEGTVLECHLYGMDQKDGPYPCTLRLK